MAIHTIGIQSAIQYELRSTELRDNQLKTTQQTIEPAVAGSKSNVILTEVNTSFFPPVAATTNTSKTTSSRRDLAELETIRNQFQLESQSGRLQGESAKALQSFLDVADFERKDTLTALYGIDIYI